MIILKQNEFEQKRNYTDCIIIMTIIMYEKKYQEYCLLPMTN